jgi:hypothetical protein
LVVVSLLTQKKAGEAIREPEPEITLETLPAAVDELESLTRAQLLALARKQQARIADLEGEAETTTNV